MSLVITIWQWSDYMKISEIQHRRTDMKEKGVYNCMISSQIDGTIHMNMIPFITGKGKFSEKRGKVIQHLLSRQTQTQSHRVTHMLSPSLSYPQPYFCPFPSPSPAA